MAGWLTVIVRLHPSETWWKVGNRDGKRLSNLCNCVLSFDNLSRERGILIRLRAAWHRAQQRARAKVADGASRTHLRRLPAPGSVLCHSMLAHVRRGRAARPSSDRPELAGQGLGPALLCDVVLRLLARQEHRRARDPRTFDFGGAKSVYEHWGLRPSPVDPMTLMITIEETARMCG